MFWLFYLALSMILTCRQGKIVKQAIPITIKYSEKCILIGNGYTLTINLTRTPIFNHVKKKLSTIALFVRRALIIIKHWKSY